MGIVIACPACGKDIVDVPEASDLTLDEAMEIFDTMVKDAGAVVIDSEAYCDTICHEVTKRGGKRMVP